MIPHRCHSRFTRIRSSSRPNGWKTTWDKHRMLLTTITNGNLVVDPDLGVPVHMIVAPTTGIKVFDPVSPLENTRLDVLRQAREKCGRDVIVPQHPLAPPIQKRTGGLTKTRHVVAVSSGKGGVGKSTIAVNLAAMFALLGARTGIYDADVHGPSLPTMLIPRQDGQWKVVQSATQPPNSPVPVVEPVIVDLTSYSPSAPQSMLKCMSFGFVGQGTGGKGKREMESWNSNLGRGPTAAMMRGPVASRTAQELVMHTNWGELDVLVVDLPPGTGDVHLAMFQKLAVTAAVVATTPQELSFVDVARGIDMLEALKVPVIGIVENMSWFTCSQCSTRHRPFGESSHLHRLAKAYGIPNVFSLPIVPRVSMAGDDGMPYVATHFSDKDDVIVTEFKDIAHKVMKEMLKIVHGGIVQHSVWYDEKANRIKIRILHENSAEEFAVEPHELRTKVSVVEDMLHGGGRGGPQTKHVHVSKDVKPLKIEPRGNYAVGIDWSDGHTATIYSYDSIVKAAKGDIV